MRHNQKFLSFVGVARFIAFLIGFLIPVFSSTEVCAQRRALSDQLPANRWSLVVKYGVGLPFKGGEIENNENIQEGVTSSIPEKYHYFSKSSYSIGARYMISRDIGLRTNYSHHYFSSDEDVSPIRTHTLGLEGIYSFSKLLPEGRISRPRKWNVLGFIGGGYTFGIRSKNTAPDRIISGVIGGTVQYRLSNSIAVSFEPVTFQFNSFQDTSFDSSNSTGTPIQRLFKPKVFWYPSVGIQVYFGKWRHHVDWR